MENLNVYNLKKKKIICKMEEIKNICIENNIDFYEIDNIYERLKNNLFSIIVVGEFSSGKSTFINSLLRQSILPAKVLPTTAIISIIEDGNGEAVVKYRDSKEKTLLLNEIQTFATALNDEGIKEAKNINHMVVKVKNLYTREGVTIIDTPGVEDLDKSREEITYNMIPKSDAAIVVLDCRRALKDSEIKFLQERILNTNINKLFFVLNFADAIKKEIEVLDEANQKTIKKRIFNKEELNIIIEKTSEKLREVTDTDKIKLYAISAKQALKEFENDNTSIFTEMFNDFENDLQRFLVEEKGEIFLRNSLGRLSNVLEDIRRVLEFKTEAVNKPLEEIRNKEQELINLIASMENQSYVITSQLRNDLDNISRSTEPDIESIIRNNITRFEDDGSVPTNLEMSEYKEIINKMINSDIDNYYNTKIKDRIIKCTMDTEKNVQILIDDLNNFLNFDRVNDRTNNSVAISNFSVNYSNDSVEDAIKKGAIIGLLPSLSTLLLVSVFSVSFGAAIIIGGIITGAIASFGLDKIIKVDKKSKFAEMLRNKTGDISKTLSQGVKANLIEIAEDYVKQINNTLNSKINSSKKSLKQIIKDKENEISIQNDYLKKIAKDNLLINRFEEEMQQILKGEKSLC